MTRKMLAKVAIDVHAYEADPGRGDIAFSLFRSVFLLELLF